MEKMIGIKVFEGLRSEGDEFAYISDWIIEEPPPGASTKERYQNQFSQAIVQSILILSFG
uniref:Uncharacterized protein n=1 Tax=Anguilla anguilla TaxID=7936 RepID=A0A0E9WIE8_ANGAN